MKVSIEYCGTCNYRPMAFSLAKVIEDGTATKVLLIHSRSSALSRSPSTAKAYIPRKKQGISLITPR